MSLCDATEATQLAGPGTLCRPHHRLLCFPCGVALWRRKNIARFAVMGVPSSVNHGEESHNAPKIRRSYRMCKLLHLIFLIF